MKRWVRMLLVVTAVVCAVVLIAATVLCLYSVKQNKTIVETHYTVSHDEIPASFEGKRIVQLTDLHNRDFGNQLTDRVAALTPDIIVITGDWIGLTDTDITAAKRQAAALVEIAPVLYVTGNHEFYSPLVDELLPYLESIGVTMLRNRAVWWEENGERILLAGLDEHDFGARIWRDLEPLIQPDAYTVFLHHHPEDVQEAIGYGVDLMLSGHTHGGQIRLPFIGTLYIPGQGWFPTYDVGRFDQDGSTLIISQGLGHSSYVRILTPPEIVIVTLDSPHV